MSCPAVFSLADLDGTNGFRIDGIDASDGSGSSVSGAGDVNGDGIDDLIVGASAADPNGNSYAGESYVVFGQASGFAPSLDLFTLDGSNGFRLDGIDAFDRSGFSVSGAGDVNGDGIDDLIIGAFEADPNGNYAAGESYVVFGSAVAFAPSLSLAALDGSNGFRLDGIDTGDYSGRSVSGAGDVNGDGIDDIIIGAFRADPNGNTSAGESYVVFGSDQGFPANLSLVALDGNNGFRLVGIDGGDLSGFSVSGAGDVNGDGFDDLIIGSVFADPNGSRTAGETYVVFGAAGGFAPSLSLADLNGTNGFRLDGIDAGDGSGYSVSGGGDVNGDGFDDLIIGAPLADPNGNNYAGESYVVFGQTSGFPANLSLADLDGSNGFRLDGIDEYDYSGRSVSGAGDVNGDGFDDLIIGALSADPNGNSYAGESYVVFGAASGFPANLSLADLDVSNGFRLDGIDAFDTSGRSVSGAGDVNGDGIDDLIIGADGAAPAGESYVVFGRANAPTDLPPAFTSPGVISVAENTMAVVTLTATDADTAAADLRFAIAGGADAALFTIDPVSGVLAFADAPDFEAPADADGDNAYALTVAVCDAARSVTQDLTVTVTDVNDGVFAAVFSLADLDGTNGFRLDGIDEADVSGFSVSSAGDVNGDGIDDLIIGASSADPNGDRAGESYVVFGSDQGFPTSLSLADLDGSNGFRLDGIDGGDESGRSVSGAGDVNGDGLDDLIIGAPGSFRGGGAGESYVVFGSDQGFAPSLSLAALDGTNGFRIDGIDAGDGSGRSVSGAGDVNGDGVDDLIIGASGADPNGQSYAGESYVVFGAAGGFAPSLSLAALDGSNGFRLDGLDEDDFSGTSVSGAGDVNGDGFDDLIIGASSADPNGDRAGESYVVFGSAAGFAPSLSLADLDGSNGFRLDGIDASDQSGFWVSGAGDVNGDGFDDIVIGALGADPNGNGTAGESYVVFGQASGFPANLSLAALDGNNGFRLVGIDGGDLSGFSVSGAGDVNGDGFDDLIIGARDADPNGNGNAGESYVVFGQASGFPANLSLAALDGRNGFRLDGLDEDDSSGFSVSGAGDVNGDGIDDLIVGAVGADPNGNRGAGESYVVFGRASAPIDPPPEPPEVPGPTAENINLDGNVPRIADTNGGFDTYTVLPGLVGDVDLIDNDGGLINLPVGLEVEAFQFAQTGLRIETPSGSVTLLAAANDEVDAFQFRWGGTPLDPEAGVPLSFEGLAHAVGAPSPDTLGPFQVVTAPASGQIALLEDDIALI